MGLVAPRPKRRRSGRVGNGGAIYVSWHKAKVAIRKTMNARMKDMRSKAKFYANAIMSTTKTVPDKSEALIKMWWN